MRAIWNEKKLVASWITIRYRRHHIRQSIRRFNKNVPSVYITHQLNVMTGNTTWLTSKLHQSIKKIYGMGS
jgi:hypothetical protein